MSCGVGTSGHSWKHLSQDVPIPHKLSNSLGSLQIKRWGLFLRIPLAGADMQRASRHYFVRQTFKPCTDWSLHWACTGWGVEQPQPWACSPSGLWQLQLRAANHEPREVFPKQTLRLLWGSPSSPMCSLHIPPGATSPRGQGSCSLLVAHPPRRETTQ